MDNSDQAWCTEEAERMRKLGIGEILSSVASLNELPTGAVIYDNVGDVMRKRADGTWRGGHDGYETTVGLPAVVVEVPE